MSIKVAVTEPEFNKAQTAFARAAEQGWQCVPAPEDEPALAAVLRHHAINYAIVGTLGYREALYEALPPGGVIARFGVGHDGVDKALATSHRLLCTNTPRVLDASVAEHTINLLLALARQTPLQATTVHLGQWEPRLGLELQGKRLAVIGCGGIGRLVGRVAARGLGMEVTGLKRSAEQTHQLQKEFGFARIVMDFNEAVKEAAFVSLHIPSVPETRHFLDRSRIAMLPVGCFLVNTARGALVDEVALYDALAAGRLRGAGLDVFESEPYVPVEPGKDLRTLENVVMTPHIGSSTREACDRMARRTLRNIQLAAEHNYAEMDLLNPEVLPLLMRSTSSEGIPSESRNSL